MPGSRLAGLTSVSTVRLYRRSCQADLLAQVATDGRQKDNAHIDSRAFAHNIGGGDTVSQHLLSGTIWHYG